MASQSLKNVIIVGSFNVSVLSRTESTATFPSGAEVKKCDLTSHAALVEALTGQDAIICTLNDEAAGVQVQLIEAAVEAGVKRFIPSEWGSIDIPAPVPEMEEAMAGRWAIIDMLKQKAKEVEASGQEFHWTAVNCGVFFDWSLHAAFLDITLPPTKAAAVWDNGTNLFGASNLSTVAAGVVAILSTAEVQTGDRFAYMESFTASQREIVSALEKATEDTWMIEETTTEAQFAAAQEALQKGDFLAAYYRWIRCGLFSGNEACRFSKEKLDNELLGLQKEDLQDVIEKIAKGESI